MYSLGHNDVHTSAPVLHLDASPPVHLETGIIDDGLVHKASRVQSRVPLEMDSTNEWSLLSMLLGWLPHAGKAL